MFDFTENTYSHMPFIAHGAAPEFVPEHFCCLMLGGKWKLHHFTGGEWKRIATGLPEDATECSPCAEYDPVSGKWQLSYIAGGFEGERPFYLYQIDDLDNPNPERIVGADVGFIFKNRVAYGGRTGAFFVADGVRTKGIAFADTEFLYRVSYNPNNPHELIFSGQTQVGELFSRVYNLATGKAYKLSADGVPAYKAAFFNGDCYYAQRGESDNFEERRIVKAEGFSLTELPSSSVLEFDI